MKPPILTKRLLLRDFQTYDWQAVHCYASDSEVIRYVQWGPNSEADSKAFISHAIQTGKVDPRTVFEFAVMLTDVAKVIGAASIHILNPLNKEAEMGYCFNKRYWQNGFATEAARAVLAFGFSQLGLHRILATVDPANVASANVLKKIGMVHEGHLRSHKLVRGVWRDTDLYAIIESDWRAGNH